MADEEVVVPAGHTGFCAQFSETQRRSAYSRQVSRPAWSPAQQLQFSTNGCVFVWLCLVILQSLLFNPWKLQVIAPLWNREELIFLPFSFFDKTFSSCSPESLSLGQVCIYLCRVGSGGGEYMRWKSPQSGQEGKTSTLCLKLSVSDCECIVFSTYFLMLIFLDIVSKMTLYVKSQLSLNLPHLSYFSCFPHLRGGFHQPWIHEFRDKQVYV